MGAGKRQQKYTAAKEKVVKADSNLLRHRLESRTGNGQRLDVANAQRSILSKTSDRAKAKLEKNSAPSTRVKKTTK